MPHEISLLLRAGIGGFLLGLAAGGTWLLPRRDEWRSFAAIVAVSIVFGFIGTGWQPDATARRLAFDFFAATLALGGVARRMLLVNIRRGAAARGRR